MTYFVQQSELGVAADPMIAGADISQLDTVATSSGLVRRELDRAITQWAVNNGNITTLQQTGDVLAPEVIGIEFSYFDGIEWRLEWDTEMEGVLPVAIEVVLLMTPFGSTDVLDQALGEINPDDDTRLRYHRMVVQLPTGQPVDDTAATGATETETAEAAP